MPLLMITINYSRKKKADKKDKKRRKDADHKEDDDDKEEIYLKPSYKEICK